MPPTAQHQHALLLPAAAVGAPRTLSMELSCAFSSTSILRILTLSPSCSAACARLCGAARYEPGARVHGPTQWCEPALAKHNATAPSPLTFSSSWASSTHGPHHLRARAWQVVLRTGAGTGSMWHWRCAYVAKKSTIRGRSLLAISTSSCSPVILVTWGAGAAAARHGGRQRQRLSAARMCLRTCPCHCSHHHNHHHLGLPRWAARAWGHAPQPCLFPPPSACSPACRLRGPPPRCAWAAACCGPTTTTRGAGGPQRRGSLLRHAAAAAASCWAAAVPAASDGDGCGGHTKPDLCLNLWLAARSPTAYAHAGLREGCARALLLVPCRTAQGPARARAPSWLLARSPCSPCSSPGGMAAKATPPQGDTGLAALVDSEWPARAPPRPAPHDAPACRRAPRIMRHTPCLPPPPCLQPPSRSSPMMGATSW